MNQPKIIAFNWKLNPGSLAAANNLGRAVARAAASASRTRVVIFPPLAFLPIAKLGKSVFQGAQSCFWFNNGPYTGQVSPVALRRLGMTWVIVGHSETRKYSHQTNAEIGRCLKSSLLAGLRPVFCSGDDAITHKKGLSATMVYLRRQIKESVKLVPKSLQQKIVFVYEPVWAISSASHGLADDPVHAARIISGLKDLLRSDFKIKQPVVLYGGSVNTKTISGFLGFEDIDGFLVGAASLKSSEISGIIRAVQNN